MQKCNKCFYLYWTSLSKKCPLIFNQAKSLNLLFCIPMVPPLSGCHVTCWAFFLADHGKPMSKHRCFGGSAWCQGQPQPRPAMPDPETSTVYHWFLVWADISSLTAFLSPTEREKREGKGKWVQSKHRHANSFKSVSMDGKLYGGRVN